MISSTIVALAALSYASFFAVASPIDSPGGNEAPLDLKQRTPRSLTGCLESNLGLNPILPLPARFTLFTQEDCVFDAKEPRCKNTPVPSYPVELSQNLGSPTLRVETTNQETGPLPTFSLVQNRLVLHGDKVAPNKDYTLSHVDPGSPEDTADSVTSDFTGYDRTDPSRANYLYPQFDVISLPDCAGVGLKQRGLASKTFFVSVMNRNGGLLEAQREPEVLDDFTRASMNSYLVVHNEDGTLYEPLL